MEWHGETLALDPSDVRFYDKPYAAYARMHERRASFVWEQFGHRCFAAHADVTALFRDRRLGRASTARSFAERMPFFAAAEKHSLLEIEPPQHTRLRALVNRAFVSRAIASLAPSIERKAHEAIDAMDGDRRAGSDLLRAYATPIPVRTIARLLGVPEDECDRLLEWSHAMVAIYQYGGDAAVEAKAD